MGKTSGKPSAVPPHAPPANPNWPSTTGNPSGGNRENAAPHSGGTKGGKNEKD